MGAPETAGRPGVFRWAQTVTIGAVEGGLGIEPASTALQPAWMRAKNVAKPLIGLYRGDQRTVADSSEGPLQWSLCGVWDKGAPTHRRLPAPSSIRKMEALPRALEPRAVPATRSRPPAGPSGTQPRRQGAPWPVAYAAPMHAVARRGDGGRPRLSVCRLLLPNSPVVLKTDHALPGRPIQPTERRLGGVSVPKSLNWQIGAEGQVRGGAGYSSAHVANRYLPRTLGARLRGRDSSAQQSNEDRK